MKIIAHRSGPSALPEQTVESAELAVENGADAVEIDLRFTKDNKIAVSHDAELKRLFGVREKLSHITLSEYRSLERTDCDRCGYAFEDYINAGISPLLLHLKEGGERIPEIMKFISEHNYTDKVIPGASCPDDIRRIREINREIPVLAFMADRRMLRDCIAEGADIIRLWQGWTDEKSVELIHSLGKKAWIMTGGCHGFDVGETDEEFIRTCKNLGADGILINDITKALPVIKE